MQLRKFNIHYDPHNPLHHRFYAPSLENYTAQDFDINKLNPFFIALKKVRDLVTLDHHLRLLLTRSRSPSQYRSLVIRIFDNHREIFLKEVDCDCERSKVENQFVFDIYSELPFISPPKHLTSPLPSRIN